MNDVTDRIKVHIRRRTIPTSSEPKINGSLTKGDVYHTSRAKNKDMMWKHPIILDYINRNLSPELTQRRKTIVSEMYRVNDYIIPALNNVGTGLIKYIFGRAKDKEYVPAFPWVRIDSTEWYVIDVASYWSTNRSASILIGTDVTSGWTLTPSIQQECIDIRYYQYHVYCYSSVMGRIHKYNS